MRASILIFFNFVMISRGEMEGFVVGGQYAEIEEFPHATFIIIQCAKPGGITFDFICGGSLVNQRIVLTAAHCIYGCGPGTKTILNMGDKNRNLGTRIMGSGFIIHEGYVPMTNYCDIALLKLKRPVLFSDKIRRVAIMKNPPYNEPASLCGWGYMNEITETGSLTLKKVDQKVWPREACKKTLSTMPRGTICASSKTPNSFGSKGDSGSGLIVRGYIQIGVVSFKTPKKGNNVVAYTDVGYFYDWITYNVRKLYCQSIHS